MNSFSLSLDSSRLDSLQGFLSGSTGSRSLGDNRSFDLTNNRSSFTATTTDLGIGWIPPERGLNRVDSTRCFGSRVDSTRRGSESGGIHLPILIMLIPVLSSHEKSWIPDQPLRRRSATRRREDPLQRAAFGAGPTAIPRATANAAFGGPSLPLLTPPQAGGSRTTSTSFQVPQHAGNFFLTSPLDSGILSPYDLGASPPEKIFQHPHPLSKTLVRSVVGEIKKNLQSLSSDRLLVRRKRVSRDPIPIKLFLSPDENRKILVSTLSSFSLEVHHV